MLEQLQAVGLSSKGRKNAKKADQRSALFDAPSLYYQPPRRNSMTGKVIDMIRKSSNTP